VVREILEISCVDFRTDASVQLLYFVQKIHKMKERKPECT
jgi:hypothetical protein